MDLLANDQSIHEQFHDIAALRRAFAKFMNMRNRARLFGSDVYCNRGFLNTNPIPGISIQQAIGRLSIETRRSLMSWITRHGPFWDDLREHSENDWLESDSTIVTDTAIGEAAFRTLHGIRCGLLSFSPSDWCFTPIDVKWYPDSDRQCHKAIAIENWWNAHTFEQALRDGAPPIESWVGLRTVSIRQFTHLKFSEDCFEPLVGVPFAAGAAERLIVCFDILDRIAGMVDSKTNGFTAAGEQLYQNYFVGQRALFSDSSSSEKQKFKQELTFGHPEEPANNLVCSWHGKVSHATLRVHFSWPPMSGKPLYVVYAGPKITKR